MYRYLLRFHNVNEDGNETTTTYRSSSHSFSTSTTDVPKILTTTTTIRLKYSLLYVAANRVGQGIRSQ